jgi:hypothetical protein
MVPPVAAYWAMVQTLPAEDFSRTPGTDPAIDTHVGKMPSSELGWKLDRYRNGCSALSPKQDCL